MEKKSKTSIIVGMSILLIVTLILLGITYAYYRTRIIGNPNGESISVTSKRLEITYDGDDDFVMSTDKWEPGSIITKTFTVTNTGEDTAEDYVVYLTDVYNLYERQQDIVWTLTCSSVNKETGATSGTCNGVSTENQYPKGLGEPGAGTGGEILVSNDIPVNIRHEYTLTIKYLAPDVDQSIDMGKTLEGRIVIYNYGDINPFSETTSTGAAYTLLSNAINTSDTENANGIAVYKKNPLTEVGDMASGTMYEQKGEDEEKEISKFIPTQGQLNSNYWAYGTGYTFNQYTGYTITGGQVCNWNEAKNNLVGKYIIDKNNITTTTEDTYPLTNRIVIHRVTNVDLNTNEITVEKIEAKPITVNEATISEIKEGNGTSYYYRGNVKNNYVDFAGMCWRIVRIKNDGSIKIILEDKDNTCAKSTSANFAISYNNTNKFSYGYTSVPINSKTDYRYNYHSPELNESLVNVFKNFQTTTMVNYLSKLVQEKYCVANKTYTDKPGTTKLDNPSDYYGNNYFYYDSYVRLQGRENRSPSLDCNGVEYTQFADGTPMYTGTLTADEVVLAGAVYHSKNAYYLSETESNPTWWTISPFMYHYGSYFDSVFLVKNINETGLDKDRVQNKYAARPSVTLASNVTITGEGTKTNPYVVGQ